MYTLEFYFTLPSNAGYLIAFDEIIKREIGSLEFSLNRHNSERYTIKVVGFGSESDALQYIDKLWAGLKWSLLNLNLPSESVTKPFDKNYYEDPLQAFNDYFESKKGRISTSEMNNFYARPAIYESSKEFKRILTGGGTVHSGVRGEDFIRNLFEGMTYQNSEHLIHNKMLRVALDLYTAYFTENSDTAKFLTLIMVLEALAIPKERPTFIKNLISEWGNQIKELKGQYTPDAEEVEYLDSLEREIVFRKENSIRNQIRVLVFETLKVHGEENATKTAKRAVELYDLRSELTHNGYIEKESIDSLKIEAHSIVLNVLKTFFLNFTNTK